MNSLEIAPFYEACRRYLPAGTEVVVHYVVPPRDAGGQYVAAGASAKGDESAPTVLDLAPDEPIKLKEAAARYGVSMRSLDRACKDGQLRCGTKTTGRDAGARVVTAEEMDRYLARHESTGIRRAA